MPRKIRRSKRRQTVSDGWLAWATGMRLQPDDPRFQDFVDFEYFATDDEIADMWRSDGHRAVAAWIATNPGTRPPLWWKFDAPEGRLRLGGSGVAHGSPCRRNGMPRFLIKVESDDPPIFESEAAYLQRHGLLSSAERKRLTSGDFEPVKTTTSATAED